MVFRHLVCRSRHFQHLRISPWPACIHCVCIFQTADEKELRLVMDTTCSPVRITGVFFLSFFLSACFDDSDDSVSTGIDSDSKSLALTLTNPAGATSFSTPDFVVNITGTASSPATINKVVWENSRGGQGTANGKDNWATGNIVLSHGINQIQITATDAEGASVTKSLTIDRESQSSPSSDDDVNTEDKTTTLTWLAPSTRDDQSPLTNLAGYVVYYGQRSGEYGSRVIIDDPQITTHVVDDLSPGTWFFSVTAYDANGFESNASSEVVRTL